jgi:hypothetical protein
MQGIVGLETNLGTLHIQVSAFYPYYRKNNMFMYYLTGVWEGAHL